MVCFRTFIQITALVLGGWGFAAAQNDKQVLGDDVFTPEELAEGATVTYLIRFQNLSADTAQLVTVRDTLDPRFDFSTFSMIAASHSFSMLREEGSVLRWYFTDIQLPDSDSGGGNSLGFILFSIQLKPFLAPGQVILNRAVITFDQTLTVITNAAPIWIDEEAATHDPVAKASEFQIVPNPNYGQFELRPTETVAAQGRPLQWWITDMQGKTVVDGQEADGAAIAQQIELEKPMPGIYWLWVRDDKHLHVNEFAVIR